MLQVVLWSAIVALYLGIAGAVGLFSRQALEGRGAGDRVLASAYSTTLFFAASALVLATMEPPFRNILVVSALATAFAAFVQPRWIPEFVWRRTFTHHYMASVMALAALWGIIQAQGGSSMAPLLITVSAVAAAAASSGATLKSPSIHSRR